MGDYVPKFAPGAAVTFTASADVIGGRLVEVSGDRMVAHAAADSDSIAGVAARDTKAGESVLVFGSAVHRLIAADAIAAGGSVSAAADGKASAAGSNKAGLALTSAAVGEEVEVRTI